MGYRKTVMKKGAAKLLRPVNILLDWAERRWLPRNDSPLKHPLIFIIGSPRSGTTLFYQAAVASFHCGYFTNLHAAFHGAPSLLQRWLNGWIRFNHSLEFESREGRTEGLMGPAESGQFWYRWFPKQPQHVGLDGIDRRHAASLRNVVASFATSCDAPIVFKNLTCGMRLQPLAQLFPEALFIVLRREPVWTAQSLLMTRRRVLGDASVWWSLEPPTIDQLRGLPPTEQVARQVVDTYRTIERDAAEIGAERFFWLDYESFCDQPRVQMAQVVTWLRGRGWVIRERAVLPERFAQSNSVRLDPDEFRDLTNAVQSAMAAPVA